MADSWRDLHFGASLDESRRVAITALISAALEAVDPFEAVRRAVHREGNRLIIAGQPYDLDATDRIFVVGAGKAGAPMAAALHSILGERISAGWVNVKRGHLWAGQDAPDRIAAIHIHEAGHPLPDAAGQEGAAAMLRLVSGLSARDLVLCVISGGGSALAPLPAAGITLTEKQELTSALLACGATINEINSVRKHISSFKGGALARAAYPARVAALVLSDVVGSPLDVIASGPTVADRSTFADAWAVLEKYGLTPRAPASVRQRLERGCAGQIPETPKPGDPIFAGVQNVIVGDNAIAAQAAQERARALGMHALLLSTYIEGEAREVGRVVAGLAKEVAAYGRPAPRPACLILGGETTVTVRGQGKGGRNQELALAAALALDGWDDVAVVALATDGSDGPTDAAGAVATGDSAARARRLGLDPARHLAENDAYAFFASLGDLLQTGPTNTNVNDLTFIIVF
jgi:glycerate 2-kinase